MSAGKTLLPLLNILFGPCIPSDCCKPAIEQFQIPIDQSFPRIASKYTVHLPKGCAFAANAQLSFDTQMCVNATETRFVQRLSGFGGWQASHQTEFELSNITIVEGIPNVEIEVCNLANKAEKTDLCSFTCDNKLRTVVLSQEVDTITVAGFNLSTLEDETMISFNFLGPNGSVMRVDYSQPVYINANIMAIEFKKSKSNTSVIEMTKYVDNQKSSKQLISQMCKNDAYLLKPPN